MIRTAPKPAAGLSIVSLFPVDALTWQVHTVPVTINGLQARRGVGTVEGRAGTTLVLVANPGVAIAISSPSPAITTAIINSLQRTPTDDLGCRDHVTSFAPNTNESAATLIPGTASRGVVCEYREGSGGRVGSSARRD